MSPAAYLDLDRAAEGRSEFVDGVMYPMHGASPTRSMLSVAVSGTLWQALRARKCEAFGSNVRTLAGPGNAYFYPDCSVYCDPPEFASERKDIFTNPTLVMEILPESTEAKFLRYQEIESLRQYVLVSQTEPRIEVFTRAEEGNWNSAVYTDICPLESIGCEISVPAVYEGITLNVEE